VLEKHGINQEDKIVICPGENVVDLPFSWEIQSSLQSMGFNNVELVGPDPNYVDF
jgi:hypothetical protein